MCVSQGHALIYYLDQGTSLRHPLSWEVSRQSASLSVCLLLLQHTDTDQLPPLLHLPSSRSVPCASARLELQDNQPLAQRPPDRPSPCQSAGFSASIRSPLLDPGAPSPCATEQRICIEALKRTSPAPLRPASIIRAASFSPDASVSATDICGRASTPRATVSRSQRLPKTTEFRVIAAIEQPLSGALTSSAAARESLPLENWELVETRVYAKRYGYGTQ